MAVTSTLRSCHERRNNSFLTPAAGSFCLGLLCIRFDSFGNWWWRRRRENKGGTKL